jgi:hypothetical protein
MKSKKLTLSILFLSLTISLIAQNWEPVFHADFCQYKIEFNGNAKTLTLSNKEKKFVDHDSVYLLPAFLTFTSFKLNYSDSLISYEDFFQKIRFNEDSFTLGFKISQTFSLKAKKGDSWISDSLNHIALCTKVWEDTVLGKIDSLKTYSFFNGELTISKNHGITNIKDTLSAYEINIQKMFYHRSVIEEFHSYYSYVQGDSFDTHYNGIYYGQGEEKWERNYVTSINHYDDSIVMRVNAIGRIKKIDYQGQTATRFYGIKETKKYLYKLDDYANWMLFDGQTDNTFLNDPFCHNIVYTKENRPALNDFKLVKETRECQSYFLYSKDFGNIYRGGQSKAGPYLNSGAYIITGAAANGKIYGEFLSDSLVFNVDEKVFVNDNIFTVFLDDNSIKLIPNTTNSIISVDISVFTINGDLLFNSSMMKQNSEKGKLFVSELNEVEFSSQIILVRFDMLTSRNKERHTSRKFFYSR